MSNKDMLIEQEKLINNLKGVKLMQFTLLKETNEIHAEFEALKDNYDQARYDAASERLKKSLKMGELVEKLFKGYLEQFRRQLFDIYGFEGFALYDKIVSELGLEL